MSSPTTLNSPTSPKSPTSDTTASNSTSEIPFRISVPDSAIEHLRAKLSLATYPDELQDSGWSYGAPLSDVRRLAEYWKDGYDWREHEKTLNETLPQFTRDVYVDGFEMLNVHYVHQKSERKNAIPLLFVHGWPGSFIEVSKILLLLVNPDFDQPAFHVVAPSLPGYAFSDNPKKKGFGLPQYAEVFNKLMLALGYDEYVAQGGDWGARITRQIAITYGPKHCKAWHTNMPLEARPSPTRSPLSFLSHLINPLTVTPAERAGIARGKWFVAHGRGYSAEQSTKPQTIGYSLQDSPVGLLAWVYEKLVEWTDEYAWTDDEVLTWISIYWFSKAGPAATVRIYYEVMGSGRSAISSKKPSIPHGVSFFPKELMRVPMSWIKASANVVFAKEHGGEEGGGHFAAWERPQLLVDDIKAMFGRLEVEGKKMRWLREKARL